MDVVIETDASGAMGMLGRLGVGKRAKHIEIQTLWGQQLLRSGVIRLQKISTHGNASDVMTEYANKVLMDKMLRQLNFRLPDDEMGSTEKRWQFSDEDWNMDDDDNEAFEEALCMVSGWTVC